MQRRTSEKRNTSTIGSSSTTEGFHRQRASVVNDDEPTNKYVLVLVKVLLVLTILFLMPELVRAAAAATTSGSSSTNDPSNVAVRMTKKRKKGITLGFYKSRSTCQNENCSAVLPERSMNCVNTCLSPNCYTSIYSDEPLEDGEIDMHRAKLFEDCLLSEAV